MSDREASGMEGQWVAELLSAAARFYPAGIPVAPLRKEAG